jgi:hypothetical protein
VAHTINLVLRRQTSGGLWFKASLGKKFLGCYLKNNQEKKKKG